MNYDVFIISHERADRVETYDTLRKGGYTDKIYVVIDDEDTQFEKYQNRFGDDLLVFCKQSYIECIDTLESTKRKSSAVYARNAVEDFAKQFNLDAFIVLDDDLTRFRFRWVDNGKLKSQDVKSNLDVVFLEYVKFIFNNNIADVSFATVMLYCGGHEFLDNRVCSSRQCYGFHIRNSKYDIDWISVINEDSITEQILSKYGYIFLTLPFVLYETKKLNTLPGGVKDVYDSLSEFTRAFFATVALPNVCRPIISKNHWVIGRNKKSAYPCIISSRYKK